MDNYRYLNEYYKGLASKFVYAIKGDKVKVLSQMGNMVLVENDKGKFYVNVDMLSFEPILKENKKC